MASFAENLIYIRQHYGVTQEALAEQLGVSRQTVSKWEAGINYPETDKLLMLCELYHTNLDDLMRGSVKIANIRDTELYDAHMNRFSWRIVLGISLLLVSVGVMMLLRGLGLSGNISVAIMLSLMVIGLLSMIIAGLVHSEFKRKNPNIDPFYSDEVLDHFGQRFIVLIASGFGIMMLGVIMLVALSSGNDEVVNLPGFTFSPLIVVAVFMFILAVGIGTLIYAGLQKSKYDKTEFTQLVIDDGSFGLSGNPKATSITSSDLKRNQITGAICGAIMLTATIVFFVVGFSIGGFPFEGDVQGSGFMYSWIAFPVGGILCGIVAILMSVFRKSKAELIAEAKKENPWVKVKKDDE